MSKNANNIAANMAIIIVCSKLIVVDGIYITAKYITAKTIKYFNIF